MSDPTPTDPSPIRAKNRRWRTVLVDLLLVVAVLGGMHLWRTRDLPAAGALPPSLELAALDGQMHRLSDYAGRPVLLHFWATWCGVCRTEYGALRSVDRAIGDDAVLLAVVEDGEDLDYITQYATSHGLDYTILRATPETMRAWNVSVFPTNIYVAPDGTIAQRTVGRAFGWGMRARLWWIGLGAERAAAPSGAATPT